jgi:hypothetical protein
VFSDYVKVKQNGDVTPDVVLDILARNEINDLATMSVLKGGLIKMKYEKITSERYRLSEYNLEINRQEADKTAVFQTFSTWLKDNADISFQGLAKRIAKKKQELIECKSLLFFYESERNARFADSTVVSNLLSLVHAEEGKMV